MNIIPSNCGNIDLAAQAQERLNEFRQANIDSAYSPDLVTGQIKHFHNTVCTWAYNVPLKFSWVILIEAHNKSNLMQEIAKVNRVYENRDWNVINTAKETNEDRVQNTVGCIFAQGVNLPGENINVDYAGITEGSNRGFINAPIINGRTNFEALEVGFLETNRSFVDGFLRPWSIVVAHKGLIATKPSNSIKANIIVHQLARAGNDKRSVIRKTFIFKNCAPINISAETLDYSPSSDFPKLQAKFSYSDYAVSDNSY